MNHHNSVFSLQIATTFKEIASIKEKWDALLDAIPNYLPTMTYEWHSAWLQANEQFIEHLHFLFAFDRNNLLSAVIPLFRTDAQYFFNHLNLFTFSGARDQIKTGIIARSEHQLAILNQVLKYFYQERNDWNLLALRRLSARKADDVFLERILRREHYPYSIESVLKIPYVIIESNWETYWKSRKKHFRHEVKRKTKKLGELGKIEYEYFESPLSTGQLQQFFKLENSGWKGINKSSLLHRPRLKHLYTVLAQLNSRRLRLFIFNLKLAGKIISSSLTLKTPHGLYVFKIAYDESFNKFSPGILLRLYELRYCFEHGLKIYDFSGKEQSWMKAFTNRGNYVMDYIIYRKTFASFLRYIGFTKLRPIIKHSHLTEKFLKIMIDE